MVKYFLFFKYFHFFAPCLIFEWYNCNLNLKINTGSMFHQDPSTPLILFLNGGPGAPSIILLFGLGPLALVDSTVVRTRLEHLSEIASILCELLHCKHCTISMAITRKIAAPGKSKNQCETNALPETLSENGALGSVPPCPPLVKTRTINWLSVASPESHVKFVFSQIVPVAQTLPVFF